MRSSVGGAAACGLPVGPRGRHRPVQVQVGQIGRREPRAARRRSLGSGGVQVLLGLGERHLLRVEDAHARVVGAVRGGRGRDVDDLDGPQVVVRGGRREVLARPIVLGRVRQVGEDRVDQRRRGLGPRGGGRHQRETRGQGNTAGHRGILPRVSAPSINCASGGRRLDLEGPLDHPEPEPHADDRHRQSTPGPFMTAK